MPRKPATTRPEPSDDQTPAPEATPTPETHGPTPEPLPGAGFFAWLRGIDLRREPGWIGGVCAGIAARLGIDPLIVRGIVVVVAILGGPALLLYAAAWLLIPDSTGKLHLEEVFRGRFEPAVAGIGGMLVLAILPLSHGFWYAGLPFLGEPAWGDAVGRALWTAALIGLLIWFVVWIARRANGTTAPPPSASSPTASAAFTATTDTVSPPAGATEPEVAAWREQQAQVRAEQAAFRSQRAAEQRAADREAAAAARAERAARHQRDVAEFEATRSHPLYSLVVIGLALVVGGLATVLFSPGEPTALSVVVGLSAALAVLAVGIIINGVRGKRAGGASAVAWLLVIPLAFTTFTTSGASPIVHWGPAMQLQPTASASYAIGAGSVELDLTALPLDDQGQDVALRLGAGTVTVVIPDDARVLFDGTVGAGGIDAGPGEKSSRVGPVENSSAVFGEPGEPSITVTVQLGAGSIRVVDEGGTR